MYQDLFDQLTEKKVIDFLEIDFVLEGETYKGLCPKKHSSDSGKSFHIGSKRFHCWSCGVGGNLIHLIELVKFGTVSKKVFSENYSKARDIACDIAGISRFRQPNLSAKELEAIEKQQREQNTIEEVLTRATVLSHIFLLKRIKKDYILKLELNKSDVIRFKIGYCYSGLLKDLLKEFNIDEISLTGFITGKNGKWKTVLRNRFLFPYIKDGQTVYFSGRLPIGKDGVKYKKMPSWNEKTPFVSKHLRNNVYYNEDAIKGAARLVLSEGITDCIIGSKNGFSTIASGGVNIKNEMLDRLLGLTRNIDYLYICFDQEDSKAGETASLKIAKYFLEHQREIKIIVLPFEKGKTDIKLFFLKNQREDFIRLIENSKTLIEFKIGKIEPISDRMMLTKDLRPIFELISLVDNITMNNYLNYLLKNTFHFKSTDIQVFRTEIKRMQKEKLSQGKDAKKLTPSSNLQALSQGLDFVNNVLYYTIFDQQLEEYSDPETGQVSTRLIQIPYIASSEREFIKATPENLLKKKLFFDKTLLASMRLSGQWDIQGSAYSITNFISKQKTVDVGLLFLEIKKYFDEYIIFPRKNISNHFTTLIMASYLIMVFDTIGYVHLHAEKQSGKTRVLEILEGLGYNTMLSSSISDASVFRVIESMRCMLLTDEAENLDPSAKAQMNNPSEKLQLLNSGYKKSGAAIRIEKFDNQLVPMKYSTFCIKVFAGTKEINPILRDRTITYLLKRADGEKIKNFMPSALQGEWRGIKNKLYFFAMEAAGRISDIYRYELPIIYKDVLDKNQITSREYEIWSPYLSIAKYIDEKTNNEYKVFSSLIKISNRTIEYKKYLESDSWVNRLIALIFDYMQQNKNNDDLKDYYNLTDMSNFIRGNEGFENLNSNTLTRNMYGKLHLTRPNDKIRIRRQGENVRDTWVKISEHKIIEAIKRHGIILDKGEK